MIINSRSTNFWFTFPKGFFSDAVVEKYEAYVKRHYLPYDTVENFMASSIQSVTFPTISMDPVQQTRLLGNKQEYKNSTPIKDLFTREMTVTMKSFEGYINYWIFMESVLEYLNFDNKKLYLDDFGLRVLDQEGRTVTTCQFKGVYFKSLSEISLSFSDNNPDFRTFTSTFGFLKMDIFLDND